MIRKAAIIIALAAFWTGTASAQDAAAGAEKAKQVCAACHGADGAGVQQFPDYPKLAGQHEDYLYKALRDYKSGARKNAIMGAQAKGLTRADIENLAAYYASLPGSLSHKR